MTKRLDPETEAFFRKREENRSRRGKFSPLEKELVSLWKNRHELRESQGMHVTVESLAALVRERLPGIKFDESELWRFLDRRVNPTPLSRVAARPPVPGQRQKNAPTEGPVVRLGAAPKPAQEASPEHDEILAAARILNDQFETSIDRKQQVDKVSIGSK